jgi:hypothetical protein
MIPPFAGLHRIAGVEQPRRPLLELSGTLAALAAGPAIDPSCFRTWKTPVILSFFRCRASPPALRAPHTQARHAL